MRSVLEATRIQSFGLQNDVPLNMRRHPAGRDDTNRGIPGHR